MEKALMAKEIEILEDEISTKMFLGRDLLNIIVSISRNDELCIDVDKLNNEKFREMYGLANKISQVSISKHD